MSLHCLRNCSAVPPKKSAHKDLFPSTVFHLKKYEGVACLSSLYLHTATRYLTPKYGLFIRNDAGCQMSHGKKAKVMTENAFSINFPTSYVPLCSGSLRDTPLLTWCQLDEG